MRHQRGIVPGLLKKTRSDAALSLLGAIGLFILGVFVVFVTFWIVYAIVWFGFNWCLPHSHDTRLWISAIVIVLLFIGNATTDRAYLESYSFTTGTSYDKPVSIHVSRVGLGSTINPLAPDSAHSYVKIVTTLLFSGPRLITAAWRLFARSLRLRAIDAEGCAAVLAFLAARDQRAPFQDIVPVIPKGHDLRVIFQQLRDVDGVLFLKSEPAGLSLTSELRDELRAV
jgi:hypothetical protein